MCIYIYIHIYIYTDWTWLPLAANSEQVFVLVTWQALLLSWLPDMVSANAGTVPEEMEPMDRPLGSLCCHWVGKALARSHCALPGARCGFWEVRLVAFSPGDTSS